MNNIISNTLKVGVAALVMLSAAGCQTKAIDEVRSMAQKAQQDAAAAMTAANAASTAANSAASTASAAKSAADNAQSTAGQALQAAQAGQACCDATNQKLDRMFKQSVSK